MARKKKRELILTELEMLKLEKLSIDTRVAEQSATIEQNKSDLIKKDAELFEMKRIIKVGELALQRQLVQNKNESIVNVKENYNSYRASLEEELGITLKKWGYNPETGEISLD